MKVLDKELLAQLVGGKAETTPGETIPGGGGGGGGGGGSGGGSGGGGGDGGGFGTDHGYAYDIKAIGVENGQEAVVTIRGAIPVFDNPPPNATISQEPAAWEGSLIGVYVTSDLSFEHQIRDGIIATTAGAEASVAGKAFINGFLKGAEIGNKGGTWGRAGGMVIGAFVGYGSYLLMERDHPQKTETQTWVDKDGNRHYPRAIAPDDDNHVASYSGPAGGNAMQMAL
ncbi:hypothetical protein [Massilia sp. CCM 8734]|uniref:hypothetical protein n=1 Tax=Massilia sp. CCM 8734 TaxID=2609283 RepID=UPI001422724B|nr:hypothetical protein [Massilia sp. CCM 8734]NHZ98622.1 hypothetical protein [Massilia sp. CCM 8734]